MANNTTELNLQFNEQGTSALISQLGKVQASVEALNSAFAGSGGAVSSMATAFNSLEGAARKLADAFRPIASEARAVFSQVGNEVQSAGKTIQTALSTPRKMPGLGALGAGLGDIQQAAQNAAKGVEGIGSALPSPRDLSGLRNINSGLEQIGQKAKDTGKQLNDSSLFRMLDNRDAWDRFTYNARVKAGGSKFRAQDGIDLASLKTQAQRAGGDAGGAGGKAFTDNFNANMNFSQSMGIAKAYLAGLTALFVARAAAIGTAFVRTLMSSLNTGAGFESQMTNVKVISGATGAELEELTAKAREMGATLPITAQQAAAAMEVMAQRGTKVRDILTSVTDVTNLVISQGLDMASAAELIGSTMTNFGIDVKNAARITDVFNNAANQSALSARTLQTSMNYVAPAAAAVGMSLEETVAAMEVLANAGLDASMVGTGMAMVLQKLSTANSVLGVQVKDVEGNIRPLKDIFKELQQRGMSLSDATKIFGARASKAALNLVKYADTLGDLESNLRKTGSTSAAVEEKMKTFQNIWESFKSAAESVHINIFEQIKEQSKEAVSGLADVTRGLSNWIDRTGVAKRATDAFIQGLGFNVDLKGMLSGLNVDAVVGWFRNMGETARGVFDGLGTAINTVKGPLMLLIKNIDVLIKIKLGGWFLGLTDSAWAWVGALKTAGTLTGMLGGIGKKLEGVGAVAGEATGMFAKLSLVAPNITKGFSMMVSALKTAASSLIDVNGLLGLFQTKGIKLIGILKALPSMVTPFGWIATAIGVVTAGVMKLRNALQAMRQEIEDNRAALNIDIDTNTINKNVTDAYNAALEALESGDRKEFEFQLDLMGKFNLKTDEAKAEVAKMKKQLQALADKDTKELNRAMSTAMDEFNASLDKSEKHLEISQKVIDAYGQTIGQAIKGSLPVEEFEKLPEPIQEFVKLTQKALGVTQIFGAELGKAADKSKWIAPDPSKQVEQAVKAKRKAELLARGEKEVQADFNLNVGSNIDTILEKFNKGIQSARDILGDADLEFVVTTNIEEAKKQLKEKAKEIAEIMEKDYGITEDIAFQGLIKQIDDKNKAGEGNEFTKRLVKELGTAKQQLDDFISKAKDYTKYLGKAPESFLPALKKMAAGMAKTDIFGNVTEEYKKLMDAINELETSSLDKFMSKFKDSVEYMGASPYKLIPQFEALAGGIRKVDDATGLLTEGYKKAVEMGREVTKVVIDKIASQSKDAIDFSFMSPEKLLPKFEALTQSINKINPVTKQVDEGFKKAYATMKEMANLTFDNLKSEIESLKKGVERGIVDKRVLDKAMKDAKKTIEVELYAQYEATRPEKEKAYKERYGGDYRSVMQNELLDKVYQKYGDTFGEEAAKAFLEKYTKFGKNAGAYYERDARAQYERERKQETAKEKKAIKDATTAKTQPAQDKGQATEATKKAEEAAKKLEGVTSVEDILKEVATNFTTGATELKAAGEAQGKAATDFANNVTGVQTAVTTLVNRLTNMETTIKANTKALDDARLALTNGGKVDTAKTTAAQAEPKTADVSAQSDTSNIETLLKDNIAALGNIKTAIENMGKVEASGAEAKAAQVAPETAKAETTGTQPDLSGLSQTVEALKTAAQGYADALTDAKTALDNAPKTETTGAETKAAQGAPAVVDATATQTDMSKVLEQLSAIAGSFESSATALGNASAAIESMSQNSNAGGADAGASEAINQAAGELTRAGTSLADSTQALRDAATALRDAGGGATVAADTSAFTQAVEAFGRMESLISSNTQALDGVQTAFDSMKGAGAGNAGGEVQSAFTAAVERLVQLEASIAANTTALGEAKTAVDNLSKAGSETGGGVDVSGVQSALDRVSGVLSQMEGALGQSAQAMENAGKLANELPGISSAMTQNAQALNTASGAMTQNAQALSTASTAIDSLARNSGNGGADGAAQAAITTASNSLSNVERSIAASTTAMTKAAGALEKAGTAQNGGGDVNINLHDFTVRQESDIQRIKQMIQDALKSAGILRTGIGLGTA